MELYIVRHGETLWNKERRCQGTIDISLNEYIERSKPIYADISSELLISIFFPRNPLHDGGVIIQGNKKE